MSAWETKPTGRGPGSAKGDTRHEAADHNTVIVRACSSSGMCVFGSTVLRCPGPLGGGDHEGMRTVEIGASELRGYRHGQFPRKHWRHLRTTNVIPGLWFAPTEPDGIRLNWILVRKTFQQLNDPALLPAVNGAKYVAGSSLYLEVPPDLLYTLIAKTSVTRQLLSHPGRGSCDRGLDNVQ